MTITERPDYTTGIVYTSRLYSSPLPELNLPMLSQLLEWAEFENRVAEGQITREGIPAEFRFWGTWDQGVWGWLTVDDDMTEEEKRDYRNGLCQTAFCMAGQAATQAGYRLIFDHAPADETRASHQGISAHSAMPQRATGEMGKLGFPLMEDVPGARPRDVQTVGREVLGLTQSEAESFFEGDNSLESLQSYANTFCAARNLPPLYPGMGLAPVDDYRYHTIDTTI